MTVEDNIFASALGTLVEFAQEMTRDGAMRRHLEAGPRTPEKF